MSKKPLLLEEKTTLPTAAKQFKACLNIKHMGVLS